jgi:hypothetical protein
LQVELIFSEVFGVDYGTKKDYIAGGDIWEVLARTLIINKKNVRFDAKRNRPQVQHSGETIPLHEEFSGFRGNMLSKLAAPRKERDESSQPPLTLISYEQMEYHTRAIMHSEERRFYITKKGYIGLDPKDTKHGDVICVLVGSNGPYSST